ncbi:hypothetical protein LZ32DRAFT_616915 [Colletotrichum eremochloae]|nr:hypothetical protein LZ32DRAFT_616915 [Colletotrichum eremochloae]
MLSVRAGRRLACDPSAMDTCFKAGPLLPDSAANPKSFDASILPREQSLKTIPLLLSNFLSAMALGGDDATAVEEVISLLTEYGVQPCEGRGDPRLRSRWEQLPLTSFRLNMTMASGTRRVAKACFLQICIVDGKASPDGSAGTEMQGSGSKTWHGKMSRAVIRSDLRCILSNKNGGFRDTSPKFKESWFSRQPLPLPKPDTRQHHELGKYETFAMPSGKEKPSGPGTTHATLEDSVIKSRKQASPPPHLFQRLQDDETIATDGQPRPGPLPLTSSHHSAPRPAELPVWHAVSKKNPFRHLTSPSYRASVVVARLEPSSNIAVASPFPPSRTRSVVHLPPDSQAFKSRIRAADAFESTVPPSWKPWLCRTLPKFFIDPGSSCIRLFHLFQQCEAILSPASPNNASIGRPIPRHSPSLLPSSYLAALISIRRLRVRHLVVPRRFSSTPPGVHQVCSSMAYRNQKHEKLQQYRDFAKGKTARRRNVHQKPGGRAFIRFLKERASWQKPPFPQCGQQKQAMTHSRSRRSPSPPLTGKVTLPQPIEPC